MARRNFNDGQEVTFADLNAISSAQEQLLMDRFLPQLLNKQQSKLFGKGMKVSYISATSVSVAAGMGIYNDSSQTSPESKNRPLYNSIAVTKTIEAAHPTNNRVDIVSIKAVLSDELTGTRKFKDASTAAISNVSMVLQKDWALDIVVTKGVEDGSAAVPSTPAGYMKLCEILVTATSGVANQAAITDRRLRFSYGEWAAVVGTSDYCTHESLAEALADANVATGSKILVENSETVSTTGVVNKANMHIEFLPGVTFTKGGSATEAIRVEADGCRINGGRFVGFSGGGDRGIKINTTCDYGIFIGQRFNNCTIDFQEDSGTATILANVQE